MYNGPIAAVPDGTPDADPTIDPRAVALAQQGQAMVPVIPVKPSIRDLMRRGQAMVAPTTAPAPALGLDRLTGLAGQGAAAGYRSDPVVQHAEADILTNAPGSIAAQLQAGRPGSRFRQPLPAQDLPDLTVQQQLKQGRPGAQFAQPFVAPPEQLGPPEPAQDFDLPGAVAYGAGYLAGQALGPSNLLMLPAAEGGRVAASAFGGATGALQSVLDRDPASAPENILLNAATASVLGSKGGGEAHEAPVFKDVSQATKDWMHQQAGGALDLEPEAGNLDAVHPGQERGALPKASDFPGWEADMSPTMAGREGAPQPSPVQQFLDAKPGTYRAFVGDPTFNQSFGGVLGADKIPGGEAWQFTPNAEFSREMHDTFGLPAPALQEIETKNPFNLGEPGATERLVEGGAQYASRDRHPDDGPVNHDAWAGHLRMGEGLQDLSPYYRQWLVDNGYDALIAPVTSDYHAGEFSHSYHDSPPYERRIPGRPDNPGPVIMPLREDMIRDIQEPAPDLHPEAGTGAGEIALRSDVGAPVDVDDLARRTAQGDPAAREALKNYSDSLGDAVYAAMDRHGHNLESAATDPEVQAAREDYNVVLKKRARAEVERTKLSTSPEIPEGAIAHGPGLATARVDKAALKAPSVTEEQIDRAIGHAEIRRNGWSPTLEEEYIPGEHGDPDVSDEEGKAVRERNVSREMQQLAAAYREGAPALRQRVEGALREFYGYTDKDLDELNRMGRQVPAGSASPEVSSQAAPRSARAGSAETARAQAGRLPAVQRLLEGETPEPGNVDYVPRGARRGSFGTGQESESVVRNRIANLRTAAANLTARGELSEAAERTRAADALEASLRGRARRQPEAQVIQQQVQRLQRIKAHYIQMGAKDLADQIDRRLADLEQSRVLVNDRRQNGDLTTPGTLFQQSPASVRNVGEFTNRDKLALSTEGNLKMDQLEREWIAEHGYDPKGRVTQQQIRDDTAAKWGPEILDNVPRLKAGETIHPARYYATQEYLKSITEEIVRGEDELARNRASMTPEEIANHERQLAILERDAKELLDDLGIARSQNGRNLAFLKMVNQGSFNAGFWLNRAQRMAGAPLSDQVMGDLRRILVRGEEAKEAGNMEGVRQARIALAKQLGKLQQDGFLKSLVMARKAGLIAAPKTIAKVTASHWLLQGMEGISKLNASLADMAMTHTPVLRKAFSGQRTVAAPPAFSLGERSVYAAKKEAAFKTWGADWHRIRMAASAGDWEGMKQGLSGEAWQIMRHGLTEEDLANLHIPHELNSKSEILNTLVNTTFRTHSAAYRGFGCYAAARSLQDSARLMAMQEAKLSRGASGPRVDVAARTRHWMQHPTAEMQSQAAYDALCATFSEPNRLAGAWSQAKSWIERQGLAGHVSAALLDQVVPFPHIPSNIVVKVLDYAGVGGVLRASGIVLDKSLRHELGTALTPAEQKTLAMAFGRGMTGWAFMTAGYYLGSKGMMTGTYDSGKREINEVANRVDGAIKIANQWVPLSALAPAGNMMVIGAELAKAKARDWSDTMGSVASVGTKTVADMPFAQGINDLQKVIEHPVTGLPRYLASQAGSFVPTPVADYAASRDPYKRELNTDSIGPAIRDQLMSKAPFLRERLPVKIDAFGRDVRNERQGFQALNPIPWRTSNERDEAIRALLENGNHLPTPAKDVTVGGVRIPLTQAQQRDLYRQQGSAMRDVLHQAVQRPDWEAMNTPGNPDYVEPDRMQEGLQGIIRTAHQAAKDAWVAANETPLRQAIGGAAQLKAKQRDLARQPVANGIEDLFRRGGPPPHPQEARTGSSIDLESPRLVIPPGSPPVIPTPAPVATPQTYSPGANARQNRLYRKSAGTTL